VFNCAAYNAVDKAEDDPIPANKINGYAVGNLAKICSKIGAVLVHYSSNYVFDGKKPEGYTETDSPHPISKYAESKLLGETELQKHGKNFYLIRSTWLYGSGATSETSKKSFVDTMLALAKEKSAIEVVADQFGQPTWTADLALASQRLVEGGHPYGTYHITNSGSASWLSWAEEIFRLKNVDIKLVPNSMNDFSLPSHKAKRPQHGLLLNTKFPPLRSWQEALKDYLTNSNS
jgi:dTDP-4-dehydrorhamnose reductase